MRFRRTAFVLLVIAIDLSRTVPAWALVVPKAVRVGSELQVNTYTTGQQVGGNVATDGNGNFMVTWYSFYGVGHVAGRSLAASGAPVSEEVPISDFPSGSQLSSASAHTIGSEFVTVWEGAGPGDSWGVFGRRLDAAGATLGTQFIVSTYTTGYQEWPQVASSNSGFVVVWTDLSRDGDRPGVFGQRFDTTGARIGNEFQVNTYTTGNQLGAAVSMNDAGNFVVVWGGKDLNGHEAIFAQRFDVAANRIGAELQVNLETAGYRSGGSVTLPSDGSFVVVWDDSLINGGFSGVLGQRFDSTGERVGSEFLVNTSTGATQFRPQISGRPNGDFVVVWQSNRKGTYRIAGQVFASDGARVGSEFVISTSTSGGQYGPSLALDDAGRFLVSWFGVGPDNLDVSAQALTLFGIAVDRTALAASAVWNGGSLSYETPPQTIMVDAPGPWTATSDQPFVSVTPSGSGSSPLIVQISAAGLSGDTLPPGGAVDAHINITAPGATNSPLTVTVTVRAYDLLTTLAPYGSFDAPASGATGLSGAVPLTGWALDDVGVESVKLYRDQVSADPPSAISAHGKVLVGDASFVPDMRPDVATLNPNIPLNYRAAWGYMLLTNFLPSGSNAIGGNGPFTLYAYAADVEGRETLLGSKVITVDNANAAKPFGTIDTPAQGATVSGLVDNFGWALTPGSATIPTDGSTVLVFVDGVLQGNAQYNLPRNDIQTLFPGYTNTSGPVGYRQIDTTLLSNGVHTIFWIVTDDQNRADGIGSRFFTVLN